MDQVVEFGRCLRSRRTARMSLGCGGRRISSRSQAAPRCRTQTGRLPAAAAGHRDPISGSGCSLNQIPDAHGHIIHGGLGNDENA